MSLSLSPCSSRRWCTCYKWRRREAQIGVASPVGETGTTAMSQQQPPQKVPAVSVADHDTLKSEVSDSLEGGEGWGLPENIP